MSSATERVGRWAGGCVTAAALAALVWVGVSDGIGPARGPATADTAAGSMSHAPPVSDRAPLAVRIEPPYLYRWLLQPADPASQVLRLMMRPVIVEQRGVVVATPQASDTRPGLVAVSCNGGRRLPTLTLGVHVVRCIAADAAGNLVQAEGRYLVVPRHCGWAVSHAPAAPAMAGCADRAG